MGATTISTREFNQKVGYAKKAAANGPVFITDRGQQTHVLLNVQDYRKIAHIEPNKTLYEALYCPAVGKVDPDFEFPRLDGTLKPVEFD